MTDNRDKADLAVEQASQEASGWMIRLQESPNDIQLRRQFADWLSDPVNASAWAETRRMKRAVAGAMPSHAGRWEPFLRQIRAETKKRETRRGTALPPILSGGREAAASASRERRSAAPVDRGRVLRRRALRFVGLAAVASLLALVAGPEVALQLQADHATTTAETKTIGLPDDSVATLAPDSAIAVSYRDEERSLHLLAGEVYLDVVANVERPFRVLAGDLRVTVLGTGFNVSLSEGGGEVGVARGLVRVEYGESVLPAAQTLQAGEFLRVTGSGRVERERQPVSQIGAWRQDQLIAQDQPFSDVLDRLRRYHAGAIVVIDDSLADQPVTGVYDLGDPAAALRGLARSQNAIVRQITPWLLVVSRS